MIKDNNINKMSSPINIYQSLTCHLSLVITVKCHPPEHLRDIKTTEMEEHVLAAGPSNLHNSPEEFLHARQKCDSGSRHGPEVSTADE